MIQPEIDTDAAQSPQQLAHDLRTPLAALHVLRQMPQGLAQAEAQSILSSAIERVQSVADLLTQLVGAPGSGNASVATAVAQVAADVVEAKQLETAGLAHARLRLEVAPACQHSRAALDADELRQVLVQLLNNAFAATGPAGNICVRLQPAAEGAAANTLEIQVSDTGRGMPRSVLYQLAGTSGAAAAGPVAAGARARRQGAAAGLLKVRERTEAWGGRLAISSRKNEGTRVVLTVPTLDTSDRQASLPLDTAAPARSGRRTTGWPATANAARN